MKIIYNLIIIKSFVYICLNYFKKSMDMKRLKILFFCVLGCIFFTVKSMQEESKKLSIQGTVPKGKACLKATQYFNARKNNKLNGKNMSKIISPSVKNIKKECYWNALNLCAGLSCLSLATAGVPLLMHWFIKNVDLKNRVSFEQLKIMDSTLAQCIETVGKQVDVDPSSLEYMYNDHDPIGMNGIVPWVLHLNFSQIKKIPEAWSTFTIAHELMHFKKIACGKKMGIFANHTYYACTSCMYV